MTGRRGLRGVRSNPMSEVLSVDESDGRAVAWPRLIPAAVRRVVAGPLKPVVKQAMCVAVDCADALLGRRTPLTPPSKLRVRVGPFLTYIDSAKYRAVGEEFFGYLVDLCGLEPHHLVLDVGCGCGQTAAPLSRYLGPRGSYEGFDIDHAAIEWCRRSIGVRFPRFGFTVADVSNAYYNPEGTRSSCEYRFPYEDASFDVAIVKSVFTHIRRPEVEHYLSEIARVLKPGGRCLATYLLLNEDASRQMAAGVSVYDLRHSVEGAYAVDRRLPEYTLAYEEPRVRELYRRARLTVVEPIRYGSWCGRREFLSFQDVVVAAK